MHWRLQLNKMVGIGSRTGRNRTHLILVTGCEASHQNAGPQDRGLERECANIIFSTTPNLGSEVEVEQTSSTSPSSSSLPTPWRNRFART